MAVTVSGALGLTYRIRNVVWTSDIGTPPANAKGLYLACWRDAVSDVAERISFGWVPMARGLPEAQVTGGGWILPFFLTDIQQAADNILRGYVQFDPLFIAALWLITPNELEWVDRHGGNNIKTATWTPDTDITTIVQGQHTAALAAFSDETVVYNGAGSGDRYTNKFHLLGYHQGSAGVSDTVGVTLGSVAMTDFKEVASKHIEFPQALAFYQQADAGGSPAARSHDLGTPPTNTKGLVFGYSCGLNASGIQVAPTLGNQAASNVLANSGGTGICTMYYWNAAAVAARDDDIVRWTQQAFNVVALGGMWITCEDDITYEGTAVKWSASDTGSFSVDVNVSANGNPGRCVATYNTEKHMTAADRHDGVWSLVGPGESAGYALMSKSDTYEGSQSFFTRTGTNGGIAAMSWSAPEPTPPVAGGKASQAIFIH